MQILVSALTRQEFVTSNNLLDKMEPFSDSSALILKPFIWLPDIYYTKEIWMGIQLIQ